MLRKDLLEIRLVFALTDDMGKERDLVIPELFNNKIDIFLFTTVVSITHFISDMMHPTPKVTHKVLSRHGQLFKRVNE